MKVLLFVYNLERIEGELEKILSSGYNNNRIVFEVFFESFKYILYFII